MAKGEPRCREAPQVTGRASGHKKKAIRAASPTATMAEGGWTRYDQGAKANLIVAQAETVAARRRVIWRKTGSFSRHTLDTLSSEKISLPLI